MRSCSLFFLNFRVRFVSGGYDVKSCLIENFASENIALYLNRKSVISL